MIDIDIVYILCIDDIDIDIDWPLPNYLKKSMGFGAKIPDINYKSIGITSEFHQTIKSYIKAYQLLSFSPKFKMQRK